MPLFGNCSTLTPILPDLALQFSATRQRLQPGVLQVLQTIQPDDLVLDLGCGNGELAEELARENFQASIWARSEFRIPVEARHKMAGNPNSLFDGRI